MGVTRIYHRERDELDLREERKRGDEGIPLLSEHRTATAGIRPARALTSMDLLDTLAPMTANSSTSRASPEIPSRRVLVLVARVRSVGKRGDGRGGGTDGREKKMGARCRGDGTGGDGRPRGEETGGEEMGRGLVGVRCGRGDALGCGARSGEAVNPVPEYI